MQTNGDLNGPEYKYEVALSFLKEDVSYAQNLADRLSDRIPVFIYTDHQDDLVGTDGMVSFPRIFGTEARIVVVLYRPKWGKTAYTAIEERAIQTRMLTEADFILLVKLDDGRPQWYSESGIYVDMRKASLDNVVGHIEACVKRRGGIVVRETLEHLHARQKRELERVERFQSFYNSRKGVETGKMAFEQLWKVFEERTTTIEGDNACVFDTSQTRPGTFILKGAHGVYLSFRWASGRISNSLSGSKLEVEVSNGARYSTYGRFEDHQVFATEDYKLAQLPNDELGWERLNGQRILTADALVELWMERQMKLLHAQRLKEEKARLI